MADIDLIIRRCHHIKRWSKRKIAVCWATMSSPPSSSTVFSTTATSSTSAATLAACAKNSVQALRGTSRYPGGDATASPTS